jgi:hypothetical protein
VEDIDKTKSDKKADKSKKNPLAVAMGAFLKIFREDFNAEIISEELELGAAFYRMIETGTANLHASKIPLLIKLLQNPTFKKAKDYKTISFFRLSAYITALQIFENEKDEKIAMESIEACDETTYELIKDLHNLVIIPLNNGYDPVKKEADAMMVYERLKEFFTKDIYLNQNKIAEASQKTITELTGNTPSLLLDFVFDGLRNNKILQKSLRYADIDAVQWENDYIYRITSLYGVLSDYKLVVSRENIATYKQLFLNEKQFAQLHYFFENVRSEAELTAIKTEYIKLCQELTFKGILSDETTEQLINQKVVFHSFSTSQQEKYRDKFGKSNYSLLYGTDNGNLIGFSQTKGSDNNNVELRELLTYGKAIDLQLFLQKIIDV